MNRPRRSRLRQSALLLILAVTFLPVRASVAGDDGRDSTPDSPYSRKEVERRMDSRPLHPIEGIWQWAGQGAFIAIEAENPLPSSVSSSPASARYRLTLIESPDRTARPGTVIGYAYPTARAGYYTARLSPASGLEKKFKGDHEYTLHLDSDAGAHLSFTRVKSGYRVSLRRLIPYLFRLSVYRQDNRPSDLDGCLRIYPRP
ncbi:MAG: hypothetical protein K2M04_07760, partial [Muribaculaceae bacterium]|nr:hypothetical protein [Muribaculaceae bacterium]